MADRWSHLKKIKDKIPKLEANIEIGLLIGCNCPKAIKHREIITSPDSSVFSSCNRILAHESIPTENLSIDFVVEDKAKEMINPSAVKQMFELDFAEHPNAKRQCLSKEDRRFLNIVKTGVHWCDDGHYELPLPLKEGFKGLPNNRNDLVWRMYHLKKRFDSLNGKEYKEEYTNFMREMIEHGNTERPPNGNKSKPGMKFYINHHGTRHPRIVFNCSQGYGSESLNKYLIQGPLLTNDLTGVL